VPALRDRIEDVPLLAQRFVEHYRGLMATAVQRIDEDALRALAEYSWPGNVRELLNTIERCMILTEGSEIRVDDLALGVGAPGGGEPRIAVEERPSIVGSDGCGRATAVPRDDTWFERPLADVRKDAIAEVEREYLVRLLRRTAGKVGRAAELAGLDPRSLFDLMRRHGIRKEDFQAR
jgi:two-component system response regulator GlrR